MLVCKVMFIIYPFICCLVCNSFYYHSVVFLSILIKISLFVTCDMFMLMLMLVIKVDLFYIQVILFVLILMLF